MNTHTGSLTGPKLCLERAKILSQTLSCKKAKGLDLSFLISKDAPDFKKTPISAEEILLAVV